MNIHHWPWVMSHSLKCTSDIFRGGYNANQAASSGPPRTNI